MADIVHRVVEVRRVAALAPGVPGARVVVAGEAQRQREQVRAPQGEVCRMEGAEAAAERCYLKRPAAIGVDPWQHLVEDPRLVPAMSAGPFLDRNGLVRPR